MDLENKKNQLSDYKNIANLHYSYLDKSFLSSLGIPFLTLLYEAIDNDSNSVLLIERDGSRIAGYITGTQSIGKIYKQLLLKPFRLIYALKSCLISPSKIYKILEILFLSTSDANSDDLPRKELLSIVVDPDFHGKGYAENLFQSLCKEFRLMGGEKNFKIIVGGRLYRAHAFYLKMGATFHKEIQVHKGMSSSLYIKDLI